MADTIITNTPGATRSDDSVGAVGWAVAIIVIVALAIGGLALYRRGVPAPAAGGTNVNVTLPSTGGNGGGTGGAGGGATTP